MRALVVEHRPTLRQELQDTLVRRGWRVTACAGRAEGAAEFTAAPFPLVVLACDLPEGDGLELCQLIRRSTVGRAAYVLALTGDGGTGCVQRVLDAGGDDYLPVPFAPAALEGRLAFAEGHLLTHAGVHQGPVTYHGRIQELERSLTVERAWTEELFQGAQEGIVAIDPGGRVVRSNDQFTRLFGFTAEEARGRPIYELIVPDELRHEVNHFVEAVARGGRLTMETVRRHKDGRLIDVSVQAMAIRLNGGPIGGYAIYRDITQRKRAEAALRESEQRYRALFDQSPVGVFLCDERLRVTHCNRQLLRILHTTSRQLLGMQLDEVRDERILPAVRRALAGEVASYEGPYVATTSGQQLWISARISPLRDEQNRVAGGIAVVEDITERERAHGQLRAQAAELERVNAALRERTLELEAAMQARSRLYSAMNHELRTPISAIMLYQELLLAGALGPLSPEQAQALEHTQTAARHLLDLVRDVLDLSKIEAGKMEISPVEVSLPDLLRDLLATALPLAQRYGSELHLEAGPEPLSIVTDPQRVRQILLNFLSNAAKYGRGRPIRVRYARRHAEVVVEVEDEGVGIGSADLPQIFEDFVQVGWQEGGTGLGLAISRRLADLLHGRLEVDSELGAGSTFRLFLPAALPSPPPLRLNPRPVAWQTHPSPRRPCDRRRSAPSPA